MKKIISILLLGTCVFPALAQDLSHPWTLRECTDWAMDHNINLLQQGNNLKQRAIDLENAKKVLE